MNLLEKSPLELMIIILHYTLVYTMSDFIEVMAQTVKT